MKEARTHTASTIRKFLTLILLGMVPALVTTVACSSNSRPAVRSAQPINPSVRPAALESVVPAALQPAPSGSPDKTTSSVKSSPSNLMSFKRRDYGVSFLYPRQYAYISARAVANDDSSLPPKSDGHDGQFTLARKEAESSFPPATPEADE